jgi:galactokinase
VTRADDAAGVFAATFGGPPAGVWSSPGRVNLIGEHTDYTGGLVMPFAIGQRAYVAVRPRADRLVRAVAAGSEVEEIELSDVGPGRPAGWLGYLAGAAWVAESSGARPSGTAHGWDLALLSDVPIGAGLSSSAALTCATLLAMDELDGWDRGRSELALLGQQVENVIVGTPCGIMDQTASLLSQQGSLLFLDTQSGRIEHVRWPDADVAELLVTDTHAPHVLADGQYAHRRLMCEEATAALGVPSLRQASLGDLEAGRGGLTSEQFACARHVITENERVRSVRRLLGEGRVADVGRELTASHASLRDDFRVTVPPLDVSVAAALAAGALGARMTGGGFGGCTIALVASGGAAATASAIDRAFMSEGFEAPAHFVAQPAQGARRDH